MPLVPDATGLVSPTVAPLFSTLDFRSLAAVFFTGLASVLTPCVYPLIPITLAVFGADAAVSRTRGFLLSLWYVSGIVLVYTILGLVSAKVGIVFGSTLSSGWGNSLLLAFLLFTLLLSLDLAQIPKLGVLQTKASQVTLGGYAGSLAMGALSGIFAAPCIGPVLGAILVFAGKSGNTVAAGILLAVYSLGFGLPFLVLGTFRGAATRLPRLGRTLEFVKLVISIGITVIIISTIRPTYRNSLFSALEWGQTVPLLCALGVIGLILIIPTPERKVARLVVALSLGVACSTLILRPAQSAGVSRSTTQDGELHWERDLDQAKKRASMEKRLIMVDLGAEWCGACHELDQNTFSDPRVRDALKQFIIVRVDFTEENETATNVGSQYGVVGLPVILFLTADGQEIPNSRILGFVSAEAFLTHITSKVSATSRSEETLRPADEKKKERV